MNLKRLQFVLSITAVVVTLTTVAIAQINLESNVTPKAAKKRDITGTWLVNINLDAEAAAKVTQKVRRFASTDGQAPFIAVETFHADGAFTENSLTDYIPPQTTPGQGVWEKTGSREFALTFYGVVVDNVSNPQFGGTYKVRSKLTLSGDGNEFSGPFTADVFDPSGNLVFTLAGTVEGRRAESEPLP